MNYWVTTHWPPREDNSKELVDAIWVPEGRETAGKDVRRGDLVVIYQSKYGRTLLKRQSDGKELRVKSMRGKEGVIAIAEAQDSIYALGDTTPSDYADGSSIWWRWYAPLKLITRTGFVPRQSLNEILGYAPNYSLHGFGDAKSGLKKVSKEQFDQILHNFKASAPLPPQINHPHYLHHDVLGAPESTEHLNLKKYVAASPTAVMKEEGVRHISTEYMFPSNDKADVVLEDRFSRIIGVEIEVAINENNLAGMLQAIKYRYMLEVTYGRNPGDSRALLVAHKISNGVKKLCARYGVETVEINKEKVQEWLKGNSK
jgi:hypothetical protein